MKFWDTAQTTEGNDDAPPVHHALVVCDKPLVLVVDHDGDPSLVNEGQVPPIIDEVYLYETGKFMPF